MIKIKNVTQIFLDYTAIPKPINVSCHNLIMEISQYKILFEQVNLLNQRYSKISELTGENFNVFKILKVQSSEVRLHSAFLAELLNPRGQHGQKDIFLKLFSEKYLFKGNKFDTDNATIEIEKHSGFINEDGTEGGRIDIILTDKMRKQIIVENKIYAGDQKSQLVRYNNYSPNADLLYLTLDGKPPSEESKGNLVIDKDFKCLSYSVNIIDWLEQCRKEVANFPIIRETITQYLNLIKYLTNQTMNDAMEKELAVLITSNFSNVEAAFTIIQNLGAIKENLLLKLKVELENLAVELNMEITYEFDFKKRYNGVYFYRKGWKHISIAFGFQNYSNVLLYGILVEQRDSFPNELRDRLVQIKPSDAETSEWWPIYRKFEPFLNWDDRKEVWTAVADGSMCHNFRNKLVEMLNLLAAHNIEL